MSDRAALVLAVLILAAIAADLAFGWGAVLFLVRQVLRLVEWLVFWR